VEAYGRGASVEKSKSPMRKWNVSLAAKAQPDEINRPADADQEADQSEVAPAQPVVQGVSNPTPKKQPRKEVSEDRPHRTLFALHHGGLLSFSYREEANVDEVS